MTYRKPRWLLVLLTVLGVVALVVAGCGGRQPETGQQAKKINIGFISWDENIANAHLFKVLLERKGYQVNLFQLDAGPLYAGLAQGNVDLFQDAWLPVTHGDYWRQYQGRLEDLGPWYHQATLNIAVPAYVTNINSLADLRGRSAVFNGQITGIDPGAGETRIVRTQMMPAYGLEGEYQLNVSSSTAMLAALEKAIRDRQPIAVTLWHPHWAYARYPLKDLQDPKGAMGRPEQIHSLGRQNFTRDFPDVASMARRFNLNDQQLNSLANAVVQAPRGQEDAAARQWADQNPQVVNAFAGP
jgi:glycine betaine/proline transport system substrate-binding protein